MLLGMSAIILIIAYAYKRYFDSWLNPASIFSLLWGSILCLYSLKLFHIYDVPINTLVVYIVGISFFLIGCLPFKLYIRQVTLYRKKKTQRSLFDFNKNVRLFFLLLTIVATLILFSRAIKTLPFWFGGVALVKRANVEGYITYSALESMLYTFFANPIETLSVFVVAIDFFFERGSFSKLQAAFTILMILFGYISSGSKFLLFVPILAFSITYFTYKYENDRSYRKYSKIISKLPVWKKILIVIVAMIISLFLIYMLNMKYGGWLESLYMYFVGCIPCGSHAIEDMSNGTRYYGMVSFNGAFRVLSQIFAFIGIKLPYNSIMNDAYNSMLIYERAVNISPTVTYNAFISVFSYFYKDGGLLGVGIGSFIFGRISYLVYRKLISEKSAFSLLLYLFICYLILFSIVRMQLYLAPTVMLLIYINILFRRKL